MICNLYFKKSNFVIVFLFFSNNRLPNCKTLPYLEHKSSSLSPLINFVYLVWISWLCHVHFWNYCLFILKLTKQKLTEQFDRRITISDFVSCGSKPYIKGRNILIMYAVIFVLFSIVLDWQNNKVSTAEDGGYSFSLWRVQ